MMNRIYPPEQRLNKANVSDTERQILYLLLSISKSFVSSKIHNKAKLSKYQSHKSEIVSHLNIDISEIFDTQTWTPKQRCDQGARG